MRYEANFVKVKQMNKMRVLVVDFYDSFVFNLVHYFESFGCQVEVISDAEININDLDFLNGFQGITLSPGPGLPQETRSMMAIIAYCRGRIPVLGVCLGMQGLGIDLGGTLYNLDAIRHGVSQTIVKQKDGFLLCDLPNQMDVGLYHSWAIKDIDPLSVQLSIFGNSDDLFYESFLKNQTASNKNISWNGKLNQEDVVKTLHQYDALCLCSTFSEMSPLVIQEAFAAGSK